MDCSEELALIERGLQTRPGLISLQADFIGRRLHVEFDAEQSSAAAFVEQIRAIGFPAELPLNVVQRPLTSLPKLNPLTLVAGVLLVAGLIGHILVPDSGNLAWWLAALSASLSIVPVARAGWRAVRLKALDMNGLMTLAGVGALATGDSFEAATALFLFNLSLWLEQLSLGRTRRAIESLLHVQPDVAHCTDQSGAISDIAAAAITVGQRLLVKPGERFPVDGVVRQGISSVDQSPITGESIPVEKEPGDTIYGGTLNGDGVLVIEATQTAEASTVAHIARLVEQAQAAHSPTQRFVDQFARRYTPVVILLAVVIALASPWLLAVSWQEAIHRGLVLLVIACPCALVISTPVTIVCGLHRAATRGILIKGGEFLEAAGRVTSIAFDKTGTLTQGKLQFVGATGSRADEALAVAAALEQQSHHPLAEAIVAEARRRGLALPTATDVTSERGCGIHGQINGDSAVVGSARWLEQLGYSCDNALAEQTAVGAVTTVCVAYAGQVLGALCLADVVRDDARQSLDQLRHLGIWPAIMLTGDRRAAAEAIAASLEIDEIRCELLPQDKLEAIGKLAREHPHLAMVGDGVNDAPALAAAPLGIALGAAASDTALEAADVVILAPHLSRVVELLELGRRCRQLLGQNIALAIIVKLATLAAAAAGWATMWMAVAADVGASLVVIFNGMRLLNGTRPRREQ